MDERFKELRKALGLSREDFAKRLGLKSRGKIENVEFGRIVPDDAFLMLVCNTYDVNYDWLKSGIGNMFAPKSKDEEIAEMFADVQKAGEDTFKYRLISGLAKLDDAGWDSLEKLIDAINGVK